MAFLEISNLKKTFGSQTAVHDFQMNIERGEFVTFLGPSGCGKTTTLRMIAGFEVPDEGEIFIQGKRMEHTPPYQRPVNTVFQSYALFQHMSVEENIAFGLRVRHVGREEIARKVETMLDLTRLGAHRHKVPSQLSGGQRQRVAVARALVIKPDAMLFDELMEIIVSAKEEWIGGQAAHLLFVARFLERIGDHATNVAERVIYMVTGVRETY